TQYAMGAIERIGLLKMDFLGLRTLTVIANTLKLIKETRGVELQADAPFFAALESQWPCLGWSRFRL
ncbi:MAG: hypothetical protein L0387_23710, partial [Acidobacteria bacterium]|nr:hypothetical protein [Acidobacteriota bacterium]